jgi:2-isopropylmalate synthase
MTKEQVVERMKKMVTYAKTLCDDIEFSPEDAGRTEPEFLYEVLEAAIKVGATTLNIPDTVGYTLPDEFGGLIAGIMANVPNIKEAVVSVHCHNDLGLATANTLAGIRAGARQAEVTINGIGERAGNTALEEIVMAIKTRQPIFKLDTNIDTTQLTRTSKLVSVRTGMIVQPNKAVVGANAFAHESGIHQDGMLQARGHLRDHAAGAVGAARRCSSWAKHSERPRVRGAAARRSGIRSKGEALEAAFARFKGAADKKKRITDAD